jgi:hypothetical protein
MNQLINTLRSQYPNVQFVVGDVTKWCPADKIVTYKSQATEKDSWSILHELGHALLGHQSFESDLDLLGKEIAAWDKADEIAASLKLHINSTHRENCLDTYRDWLHQRSACPTCANQGLQTNFNTYTCLNCSGAWSVTDSRLHRPYRKNSNKKD